MRCKRKVRTIQEEEVLKLNCCRPEKHEGMHYANSIEGKVFKWNVEKGMLFAEEVILENQLVYDVDYINEKQDLLRLQKQLIIHEDLFFHLDECGAIWQNYSWDLAASWLFFPEKDEDILHTIKSADRFESFVKWCKI